jgi:tetratricopeptide (TPR) repeat protein
VAAVQIGCGRLEEAAALIAQIELLLPAVPAFPVVDLLTIRAQLATVRFSRGEFTAAEGLFAELLPQLDRHVGPAFDRTAIARSTHARTLAELGRVHEAVALQQANVDHVMPRAAAEPEAVNLVRLQLVRLLTMAGHASEAEALARELLDFLSLRQAQPTRYREGARAFLADALLAQGRREEGLRELQAALDHSQQMGRADNAVERAGRQLQWAVAARALQTEEAQGRAAAACQVLAEALGAANPRVLKGQAVLAWVQGLAAPAAGRVAARAGFVAAREQALAALPAQHPLRAELLAAEAEIVAATDTVEAAELQAGAERLYRQTVGQPLPPALLSLH